MDTKTLRVVGGALTALRKVKSENRVSQCTMYAAISIEVVEADRAQLDAVYVGLMRAAHVRGDLSTSSVAGEAPIVVAFYGLDPSEFKKPASVH